MSFNRIGKVKKGRKSVLPDPNDPTPRAQANAAVRKDIKETVEGLKEAGSSLLKSFGISPEKLKSPNKKKMRRRPIRRRPSSPA